MDHEVSHSSSQIIIDDPSNMVFDPLPQNFDNDTSQVQSARHPLTSHNDDKSDKGDSMIDETAKSIKDVLKNVYSYFSKPVQTPKEQN